MGDIILQEGQVLLEAWHVEFVGKQRRSRPVDEWIECRVVKMYHGTIYGGANGVGKTVEEARLNAILGLANAICDDVTAFDHDADEIFKGEMYRWWSGKLDELAEEIDSLDEKEDAARIKKLRARINRLHKIMCLWQEDYDYWPETPDSEEAEAREARTSISRLQRIRADTDRRRAASARLRAKAASVTEAVEALAGTDASKPASSPD
jgi:hypothetical protein